MKIFTLLVLLAITPWTYALTPIVVGIKSNRKLEKQKTTTTASLSFQKSPVIWRR